MSLTSDDLLKRLKPTKAFAIDARDVRALAQLAIELGPEGFVRKWTGVVAKPAKSRQTSGDGIVADLKKRAANFGASRKLSSAETATALLAFAAEHHSLPEPTKAALKGVAGLVGWLSKSLDDQELSRCVDDFIARYGPSTSTKHRLPQKP